jgi:hypothetical protein
MLLTQFSPNGPPAQGLARIGAASVARDRAPRAFPRGPTRDQNMMSLTTRACRQRPSAWRSISSVVPPPQRVSTVQRPCRHRGSEPSVSRSSSSRRRMVSASHIVDIVEGIVGLLLTGLVGGGDRYPVRTHLLPTVRFRIQAVGVSLHRRVRKPRRKRGSILPVTRSNGAEEGHDCALTALRRKVSDKRAEDDLQFDARGFRVFGLRGDIRPTGSGFGVVPTVFQKPVELGRAHS